MLLHNAGYKYNVLVDSKIQKGGLYLALEHTWPKGWREMVWIKG